MPYLYVKIPSYVNPSSTENISEVQVIKLLDLWTWKQNIAFNSLQWCYRCLCQMHKTHQPCPIEVNYRSQESTSIKLIGITTPIMPQNIIQDSKELQTRKLKLKTYTSKLIL